jgi:hypothetical protein
MKCKITSLDIYFYSRIGLTSVLLNPWCVGLGFKYILVLRQMLMHKRLVHKPFNICLGEETMDSDFTDKPSAPLPHFEVLREELEEDQIRVREFMKGSFTYKVQEKQTFKKVSYI